ncbi:MAG: hypothetical protein DMF66_12085 [Acidobacteria bacterium]|nr:MAG: hypothetical protein DMF66_12085 [Acidobacteriota bacterium]
MKASESVKLTFSVVNFRPDGRWKVMGNMPTMIASGTSASSVNCSVGSRSAAMSATDATHRRRPAAVTVV